MIQQRVNASMSLQRPSQSNDAMHLFNYLNSVNPAYGPSYYDPNQQPAMAFNFNPGMKDVPQWLKTLRLHKYTNLFMNLTYEQMMSLNDKALEIRGITMGARGKILQSVTKLQCRPSIIREAIAQLENPKNPECRCPILHLRQFLSTPIRPYLAQPGETHEKIEGNCVVEQIHDENLPALLVLLCQKVQNFVINCRQGEVSDDNVLMLFKSHDLILSNEAFTENQKRRVIHLKKQAKKYVSPGEIRRKTANSTAGPPMKCDFCIAHDALIGPAATAVDVMPTSTVRQQPGARKKSRDPRKNRNRAAEMEIGEWNPAPAPNAATANMDMVAFSQLFNCLQLKNAIEREYSQSLLRLAENGRNRSFVATAPNGSQYDISITRRPHPPPLMSQPTVPPAVYNALTRQSAEAAARQSAEILARHTAEHSPRPDLPLPSHLSRQSVDLPGISYIPQYRSRSSPAETPAPAPVPSPRVEKPSELRWPVASYNDDFEKMLKNGTSEINLWSAFKESGDTTSGYSSSTSERGSGAGSPRAPQDVAEPKEIPAWNTWDPVLSSLFLDEMTRSRQSARC